MTSASASHTPAQRGEAAAAATNKGRGDRQGGRSKIPREADESRTRGSRDFGWGGI